MVYSQEFFNQRSFEVVWAVFRVSDFCFRIKMKEALETRALDYIIRKDLDSLTGLEEIVNLAINTKDISSVNGGVLLREINNLRIGISDIERSKDIKTLPVRNPDDAPEIEEVFSKPPMLYSEFFNIVGKIPNNIEKESGNEKNDLDIEKVSKMEDKEDNPAMGQNNPAIIENRSGNEKTEIVAENNDIYDKSKKSGNDLSTRQPVEKVIIDPKIEKGQDFESRQRAILSVLKNKPICHIKQISSIFPSVSQRTLRYDIQRMIDRKLIDRIGGGPSSFIRLKKTKISDWR